MIWKNFHRTFFFFLNPAEALPPLCFEEEREREPESAVNLVRSGGPQEVTTEPGAAHSASVLQGAEVRRLHLAT